MRIQRLSAAFTLIELLIVVAIVGILSAIAVVNLRTASVKAKVAAVHSELRILTGALQAYYIDWRWYPPEPGCMGANASLHLKRLRAPVAYVHSEELLFDVFDHRKPDMPAYDDKPLMKRRSYDYGVYEERSAADKMPCPGLDYEGGPTTDGFFLISVGPDHEVGDRLSLVFPRGMKHVLSDVYDPTNGTVSVGDIGHFGGVVPGVPYVLGGYAE